MNMQLKSSIARIFAVTAVLLGFGAARESAKTAKAEPSCISTGINCAKAADGTIYYKGEGY